MTAAVDEPAVRYFDAIAAALAGLEIFMRDDRSPLYRHGIVAKIVAEYIARLEISFSCWRNRLGFVDSFRISRAESGFPVFQNLLELENDRRQAEQRLANIPAPDELRGEMADFILRHKEFPAALQKSMAERLYLEDVKGGDIFGPFTLAKTAKVSVNPKTMRPFYLVHWASFDGSANLPLIYMATVEDSSEAMIAPTRRRQWQAQREGRHPASRRRPAQSRARPPLRRFHREELGLHAVARDDRRQSRQGFRESPPQAAAARRARSLLFGWDHRAQFGGHRGAVQGAQGRERLAAHLDDPGGLFQGRASRPQGPVVERKGHPGVLHQHRRPRSRAPGRVELREARADPARGLPGALCRRRGAEDLPRLQGPHPVQGTGRFQMCEGSWTPA